MKLIFSTLKKILFWSYERGTWQYDIMCVLILAFVFIGPNSVFHTQRADTGDRSDSRQVFISSEALAEPRSGALEQRIEEHLSRQYGYKVEVSGIKPVMDESGNQVGYLAWEK